MPAVPLPVALEEKLDDVAAEVRRLRVLRGASWFAAVTFALPLLAVTADVLFDLSAWARGGMLAGWVAAAAGLFWLLVVRRIRGDIPPGELAAAVEREYPALAERLSTLVELSEHADAGNGSRAMIALLAKETEKRAKKMNFARIAPTGFSLRLAGFAVLVGLFALTPLFAFRGATERVRRLVLPWYTPPVEVPYKLTVSSGNPVVKRGEPVTLSAYLERTKPEAELPTEATLVYRVVGQTEERRLPMSGDEKAAFTVTRPTVDSEFEYKVECGELTSEWFGVSVVDAVGVDEAASTITLAYPAYTGKADADSPWGQVKVVQHGTARFAVRLTREPADVHAEWRAGDLKADRGGTDLTRTLTFSDDRRTVFLSVPCPTTGTVKFTLFAEKNVRTEVPVAVEADPDRPPVFDPPPAGMPAADREVKKDSTLTLDVGVVDDWGVGKLYFDYAPVNAAPDAFQTEELPLKAVGAKGAGKFTVSLAGKAALGDTVRVRLRATDNRSIPELNLLPNEAVFPKEWARVRVVENAKPLAEQDILAKKQAAAAKLDAAAKSVDEAAKKVADLKKEVAGKPKLTGPQAGEAADARDLTRQAARQLDEFAADAGRSPDTDPLADAARKVAEEPLAAAADELRKAGTDPKAEPRDESLKAAGEQLAAAAEQLKRLKKESEDGANRRLDKAKLDKLAEDQRKLGEEAAKADADKRAALEEKQKELNERLKKLREESEALKKANADAERQTAEELAKQASELAGKERELNDAVEKSRAAARREQLGELQKLQRELNEKADKLGEKQAGKPLDDQPFDKADELLGKDKPADALTEQEKAARELDRLAEEMSKRAKDRGDAKQAAEQLKKWQEDLNRRSAEAGKNHPEGVPQADKDKLAAEQKAIGKAADRLKLPKSDSLEKLRADAAKGAADAADGLEKKQPGDAAEAQKKAADALAELAERTPSNQQRRDAAKGELEKLRRDQDQLAKDAKSATDTAKGNPDDPAARDELAKKLADQAAKQDELEKKLRDLDAPGAENRRDRAADAGKAASDDLKGGLPQDIPASQEQAKRQMERLNEALEGKTPADEKAGELARLQRELTKNLQQAKKPEDLQRLQRQQQDLSKEVAKLKAPEAAGPLADAQDAAKAAGQAAEKPMPDADELKKKGEAAADALDKLADRLSGESPEQKLERLAKGRQTEADRSMDAEKTRSDPGRSIEARKKAEQDLAELNDTRSGDAQAAKKKLQDALDKLAKTPEPDKAKDAQQQAADAARQLADAVKKNGDRASASKPGENPTTDPADPTDPGNALPTEKDAQAARDLAKKQRELRDDVAAAAERTAKGEPAKPSDTDPLGDAAKEQEKVAKEAKELADAAKEGGDPSAGAGEAGAKAAGEAAGEMKSGDPAGAKKAADDAASNLKDAAKAARDPVLKRKAEDLAKRQEGLAKQAGEAGNAAAAKRQENRQGELKGEADKLAGKLDQAAKEAEPDSPASKKLNDAADAAKKAGEQMEKADRAAKGGKPGEAEEARGKAERNLEDAARAARGDSKPDGKPDPNAKPTDDAVKAADKGMKQAEQGLKDGDGQKAADAAKQAADKLQQAGEQLAQGDGKGEGKDGGKPGSTPGNPKVGPGGEVPSIVVENLGKSWGELPGDVKNQITQELKAKYGDDYARVIKLYFEQLAERK